MKAPFKPILTHGLWPRLIDNPDFLDLSAAHFEETITHHDGEGTRIEVTEEAADVRRLAEIHNFIEYIAKHPDAKAYATRTSKHGKKTSYGTAFGLRCLTFLRTAQFQPVRGIRYSENIELFISACNELGFPLECNALSQIVQPWMNANASPSHLYGMPAGEAINRLLQTLRKGLKSRRFQQRKADRKIQSERNFQAGCDYINTLFEWKKRLLIIRVDLHFRKEVLPTLTYDEMAGHMQRFLNNFRHTKYGKAKLGFIRKFEDGHSRGPHIHLLLILDGSEHQQHAFIAEEVGKYWEQVTDGKGYYFSCHRNRSGYLYPALGMIDRDDHEKRQNLIRAVRYLTKSEQFMKIEGFRCFGKGKTPTLSKTKRGRPVKSHMRGQLGQTSAQIDLSIPS
ncbi:inovirus Gp2 family protein [Pelomonas sp. CA6]|uniref:YagK/YfjJ domain-containing protein n=1 Tax=Pelomonas sp. CA6 TaxID=2907999 RepID=UPI001F4C1187|nr:inovirus-type Gp2 protein [Pelomonas sp. CA6]MCH7343940.1 inovirus Gp2 family protein [Pelomonas sp. CA6]